MKLTPRVTLAGTIAVVALGSLLAAGSLTWTSAARATSADITTTPAPTGVPSATPPIPSTPPTPAAASAFAASAAPGAPAVAPVPTRVLAIGDSIMKGFGLSRADAWPELISAANGWSLDSLACDGAGFVQPGSSLECGDTFVDVSRSAAPLAPDLIIIEGSSNDFGQSNPELLPATISALKILRTQFPKTDIIGLSTVWSETTPPAQLADINSQVQEAVEAVGGHYLDIGQPLSGHPELMQGDDVHPTVTGQIVLAAAIQTAVTGEQQALALQQKLKQEQVEKLKIMARWVD